MAARLTTYVVVAIVAATLIAGLMVGAQRDDSNGPVDLIVFNAKVYTADASGTMAEAVAVRGNQILRVGSDREIERLRRPQTVVVDAHGAAVVPGFNDGDVQFMKGALSLGGVDLLQIDSIVDAQAAIAEWAETNPQRPWVLGHGWSGERLGASGPTRQLLDAVVSDRPACLVSADGRAAWVNTKALKLAGITRRTANPAGGVIERDPRGEAVGILKGTAAALVQKLVPRPGHEERAQALRAAIAEAHENGITSVQDATVTDDEFALYEEARQSGELNLRVYSSIAVGASAGAEYFNTLEALSRKYPDDPFFKVGGARITLDGPVDSGEAALLDTAAARTSFGAGETAIAADDLNRLVRMLDARGWQVTIEAYGDRAVRMALNAYEHAARSNPKPARGRRNRIEHLAFVDAEDAARIDELGVVALLRPAEARPLPGRAAAWTAALGEDRTAAAWPLASLAGAHTRLELATGWPVAPLDPLDAIDAAVNRAAETAPDETWSTGESLPLKRAIDAFTAASAYASFDEQRKGTLKPGMLADLVVLSNDIFSGPPSRVSAATVAVTIFDGKIVYRRSAKSTD